MIRPSRPGLGPRLEVVRAWWAGVAGDATRLDGTMVRCRGRPAARSGQCKEAINTQRARKLSLIIDFRRLDGMAGRVLAVTLLGDVDLDGANRAGIDHGPTAAEPPHGPVAPSLVPHAPPRTRLHRVCGLHLSRASHGDPELPWRRRHQRRPAHPLPGTWNDVAAVPSRHRRGRHLFRWR